MMKFLILYIAVFITLLIFIGSLEDLNSQETGYLIIIPGAYLVLGFLVCLRILESRQNKNLKPSTYEGLSTVQINLISILGYTPHCGNQKCSTNFRTDFNGKQFECSCCGWESDHKPKIISEYIRLNGHTN